MPHYADDHCGCEIDGDGSKAFPYSVQHMPLTCRPTIELVKRIQDKQRERLAELMKPIQEALEQAGHQHLKGCDPEEGPNYCVPTCKVYR